MVKRADKRKNKSSQRRKAERFYTKLHVAYKKGKGNAKWSFVPHDNIGGLGLCIVCNEPLKVGEDIALSIGMANGTEPSMVAARVAWCRKNKPFGYKAGVEFIEADDNDRLYQFICENMLRISGERCTKEKGDI